MKVIYAALAGLTLTAGAALAQDFPVTVTDDRPAEVTFDSAPMRLITLANFATDMAARLGIETLGVTTYEGERPIYLGDAADIGEDLGDLTGPNLELMATLDPDLTIGMLRYNGPYEEDIEAFGKFLAYDSNTIADSLRIVSAMGKVLGHADEAEEMNASYMALLEEITAKAPQESPSYLFIWDFYDTMYAYQDNLMPAEVLSRIGATNLAGSADIDDPHEAFVILEPEDLLNLDPDVLFVFASHGSPVKHSPLYDRLSAVQNGRAWRVGYQFSQSAGPIAREMVVREAAHLLYPNTFPAPDMLDAARATPLEFAR